MKKPVGGDATFEQGASIKVEEGHLHVMGESDGYGGDVVAIYAPSQWKSASVGADEK
ncbi:hypothetical protein BC739_001207 [Kutzneria viridogrisea]|uniref:Uncharacterized protein n=1 Tax=Kutzneria viridogrisea TaxID=47990 RepID=A0ABR6BAV8_9PSEU|nr:hypothetical protein [Kutzneria viridogrisea]